MRSQSVATDRPTPRTTQVNDTMKSPKRNYRFSHAASVLLFALVLAVKANAQQDLLPSWNDGPAKQSIENFVKVVTDKSGAKYVKSEDRIATFDRDGSHEQRLEAHFRIRR
jgi:hypothetical protein